MNSQISPLIKKNKNPAISIFFEIWFHISDFAHLTEYGNDRFPLATEYTL
jgi:hypothetical protein